MSRSSSGAVTPRDKPVNDQLVRMALLPSIEEALMYKKVCQSAAEKLAFAIGWMSAGS